MSRVGMAKSFKYIKAVIYLWKMRLKQERHSVWLHFKRQACIIPALIRFPEVQLFPGSPVRNKKKPKQNKAKLNKPNPNICQRSDQWTQGVLKISAGMQAMSWAPNGSKSIQNQPPANTPRGNQHLVKFQLFPQAAFEHYEMWRASTLHQFQKNRKKSVQSHDDRQGMHSTEDWFTLIRKDSPYETKWWTAATDAGVAGAGLGLSQWLSQSIVQEPFSVLILLQQRNR